MLQELAIRQRYKIARENLMGPRSIGVPISEVAIKKQLRLNVPPVSYDELVDELIALRKERTRLLRENNHLRQRFGRASDFEQPVLMKDIKEACSEAFGVTVCEIESDSRQALICRARDAAAWLGRRLSKVSTTGLGEYLGGRDHSTVVVAITRCANRMKADENHRFIVNSIYERLAKAAEGKNVEQ